MALPTVWPAAAAWDAVVSWLPGFSVEVLPEVDSTNSELMRRVRAGLTAPLLLVAEHQTAGRGRLGRGWESAPGDSLTFSLGLPLSPLAWSGLSLVVGVAVAQALHPGVGLKWPNDLWVEDRKLGGILLETASLPDRSHAISATRYAVAGVGLNIALPAAQGLATPPAALRELWPQADAPSALARIVAPLAQALREFEALGFAPWQARFAARDRLQGRTVTLSDGTAGTACGVDPTGALRVDTAAGRQTITSSHVSVRPAV